MRLSLIRNMLPAAPLLAACAALALVGSAGAQAGARLERRLGAMGTWLTVEVVADDRAAALAASEAALRAVQACEARLSTWRDDSELARLNATPVGEPFTLSSALERELGIAREVHALTDGAFDPSVGTLVEVWGLRSGGRAASASEIEAALVPGGLSALQLEPGRALRTHAALRLEEGGFGKGAGLDDARAALVAAGARSARVDLGGQVLALGEDFEWDVAHPLERDVPALRLSLPAGSLATSGNSERAVVVDGRRLGHLLDPRNGRPAPDFGSVTVWAADATRADALATGLFVLGPEAALELASAHDAFDALVLEALPDGGVRARATGRIARGLRALDPRVRVEPWPHRDSAGR
ncbi:MAG TPA: FAD:protein FMN transferase [Planctomycetota bacterium]|nr:FAD:protein FMN transferase [Planctomycetota bacterium]